MLPITMPPINVAPLVAREYIIENINNVSTFATINAAVEIGIVSIFFCVPLFFSEKNRIAPKTPQTVGNNKKYPYTPIFK